MKLAFCIASLSLLACCEAKTALVLAGGGAKGTISLGYLEEICKTPLANSWDMLVGTSIGSLAAGLLAQYPKDQQCGEGLRAAIKFWEGTRSAEDVFYSTSSLVRWNGSPCMSLVNAGPAASSWYSTGGACSASPGSKRYRANVNAARIKSSGMELWVPASPLSNSKDTTWFTNSHPKIIDGIIASGAISPLIPPVHIDGEYYVDGGVFHNTPIIKPLQLGAKRVIVLSHMRSDKDDAAIKNFGKVEDKGPAVLRYMLGSIESIIFLTSELSQACALYPDREIVGVFPRGDVGGTIDFSASNLAKGRELGRRSFRETGLVNLCDVVRQNVQSIKELDRQERQKNGTPLDGDSTGSKVLIFFVGAVAGVAVVLIAVLVPKAFKNRKVVTPASHEPVIDAPLTQSLMRASHDFSVVQ